MQAEANTPSRDRGMTAIAVGYRPTRDQMGAIVAAARTLYRFASRWRRHAQLPGYPVERGNLGALGAIFRLERALNPDRLSGGHASRLGQTPRDWPDEVAEGLTWVDNLVRMLTERHGIGSMEAATDFREWTSSTSRLPETFAIRDDELRSLREAIRLLPQPGGLPESSPTGEAPGSGRRVRDAGASVADTGVPVTLLGPQLRPFVLGRPKERLNPAQYRVVGALLGSGDRGLSKAELERESASGDAVNVLKRLAKSDIDWASVISLPGRPGGFGYRLVTPVAPGPPAEGHRGPQATTYQAHTSAEKADSSR